MRSGLLYVAVMEREGDGALRMVSPAVDEDLPSRVVRAINAGEAVAQGLIEILVGAAPESKDFDEILVACQALRRAVGRYRAEALAHYHARKVQ